MEKNKLDKTGKSVFDNIYTSPDPRAYCSAMSSLDYIIPDLAQPSFKHLLSSYRQTHHQQHLTVLDLGASYGINAALLRYHLSLNQFYRRYNGRSEHLSTTELVARDQEHFQHITADDLSFIGLDISSPALNYGQQTNLLQASLCVNLETDDLTSEQQHQLENVDCVISSGCIGYITTKTLEKLLQTFKEKRPWMTHCILRMFPLETYTRLFEDYGYSVSVHPQLIRQRRFASPEEQEQVTNRLKEKGINTQDYEDTGWLYSHLITLKA